MAPTAADFLLERLRAWDVRHQEMAAFEAVGYA
jgi:hypothetical protein